MKGDGKIDLSEVPIKLPDLQDYKPTGCDNGSDPIVYIPLSRMTKLNRQIGYYEGVLIGLQMRITDSDILELINNTLAKFNLETKEK